MKKTARITAFLLLIAALIWAVPNPAQVQAQGNEDHQLPAVFTGTATINQLPATEGAVITAAINEANVASTTVTSGRYVLSIPPRPQFNYSGMVINFTIAGLPAREKAVWTSDGGGPINLSYTPPKPARINKGVLGVNTVLTDGESMTLYSHSLDSKGSENNPAESACTSPECLNDWTPLPTSGQPAAGQNIDAERLSTIQHPTEGSQVTYNGWPLYRSNTDEAPGQATGQGNDSQWWVLSTEGNPIIGTGIYGPAGTTGEEGQPGQPGKPGQPGQDGTDGQDGTNGRDGIDGTNGRDGIDGTNGVDGKNGAQGQKGAPGMDGPIGPTGLQGQPGEQGPPGLTGLTGNPGADANRLTGQAAMLIALIALAAVAVPKLFQIINRRRTAQNELTDE